MQAIFMRSTRECSRMFAVTPGETQQMQRAYARARAPAPQAIITRPKFEPPKPMPAACHSSAPVGQNYVVGPACSLR